MKDSSLFLGCHPNKNGQYYSAPQWLCQSTSLGYGIWSIYGGILVSMPTTQVVVIVPTSLETLIQMSAPWRCDDFLGKPACQCQCPAELSQPLQKRNNLEKPSLSPLVYHGSSPLKFPALSMDTSFSCGVHPVGVRSHPSGNSGIALPLHLFAFHLKGSLSPQGSGMVKHGCGVSPTRVELKPNDLDLKNGSHRHGGARWNNHLSCSWLATSPWNLPSSSLTCLRRHHPRRN